MDAIAVNGVSVGTSGVKAAKRPRYYSRTAMPNAASLPPTLLLCENGGS